MARKLLLDETVTCEVITIEEDRIIKPQEEI